MQAATLNACVSHWVKRVETGKIAFQFKAVEDAHRRHEKPGKKRRRPLSDDEEEDDAKRSSDKDHQDSVEVKNGTDGDDNDPVEEQAGKGKAKAMPRLWYDHIIAALPNNTTYVYFSPSDVPKQVQDQIDFLLSLSQEPEYVKLVKQIALVPVCHISKSFSDTT